MLKLQALEAFSHLHFEPEDSSCRLESTFTLRLYYAEGESSQTVEQLLVSKSTNPKVWIEGSTQAKLQVVYPQPTLPQVPLSLENYLTLYKDPTQFRLLFSLPADVKSQVFALKIKCLVNYNRIDSLPVFFKACSHTIVGLIPSQPKQVKEEWIDNKGSSTRTLTYDWQVVFSGTCMGEYDVEDQEGRSLKGYEYKLDKESDPQSVGFVIGRFKYERFSVTLKESSRVLETMLLAEQHIGQPQLVSIFSNYIYELIPILNKMRLFRNTYFPVFILDATHPPLEGICVLPTSLAYPLPPATFPPVLRNLLRGLLVPYFAEDWIIEGFANYIDLTTKQHFWKRKFNKIWEKLIHEIARGTEDVNLGVSQWRGTVIVHMLSEMTHQSKWGLAEGLIGTCIKEETRVGEHNLFRLIKNTFGIKSIKHFAEQFVRSSGATRLASRFWYTKKQNKIVIELCQKPISHRHFLGRNKVQVQLAKFFSLDSQILQKLKLRNPDLAAAAPVLVPESLHALPFLRAHVKILIAETNQQEYKEDQYHSLVDQRHVSTGAINYRSKLKKNIQKKDKPGQALPKFDSSESQMPNRLPGWLKVDPERCHLFTMDFDEPDRSSNAEYILRSQLNNEKNQLQYFRVLQKALKQKSPAILNALLAKLDLRESNQFPRQIRAQIIEVLPEYAQGKDPRIRKFLLDLGSAIFLTKDKVLPNYFTMLDMYQLKLAIIIALSEMRVKEGPPVTFDLAQGMVFQAAQPSRPAEEDTVALLLRLWTCNNNSYNKRNDAEYKATLIRALTRFPKSKHSLTVIQQLAKEMELEVIDPSFNSLVAKQLARSIHDYVDESLCLQHEKESFNRKFKALIKRLAEQQVGHGSLQLWHIYFQARLFRKQSKMRHKEFILYFYQKLQHFRLYRSRLYAGALSAVASVLQSYSSHWALNPADPPPRSKDRTEELVVRKEKYSLQMQTELPLEQSYAIAELLWERLVASGVEVRKQWLRIYKSIYFYFTPAVSIAYHRKYPGILKRKLQGECTEEFKSALFKDFIPDVSWFCHFSSTQSERTSVWQSGEEVARLPPRPKQKSADEEVPLTGDCTALEAFIQRNPQRVNWIELSKTIVDRVLHTFPQVQQLTAKAQVTASSKPKPPLSLRGIRKKLKKGCIPKGYDMDRVEEDIKAVLAGRELGLVTQMFKQARKALSLKQKLHHNIKDLDTKIVIPLR